MHADSRRDGTDVTAHSPISRSLADSTSRPPAIAHKRPVVRPGGGLISAVGTVPQVLHLARDAPVLRLLYGARRERHD